MCLAMEESISMLELMRVKESAMMDAVGRLSISFLIFCRCLSCVLDCECSYLMQLASSSLWTSKESFGILEASIKWLLIGFPKIKLTIMEISTLQTFIINLFERWRRSLLVCCVCLPLWAGRRSSILRLPSRTPNNKWSTIKNSIGLIRYSITMTIKVQPSGNRGTMLSITTSTRMLGQSFSTSVDSTPAMEFQNQGNGQSWWPNDGKASSWSWNIDTTVNPCLLAIVHTGWATCSGSILNRP